MMLRGRSQAECSRVATGPPSLRTRECCSSGFTLVEMMASMAASVIVIGGLLISSISVQKVLNGSDKYATAYSDQRRLIDYISRDLRRAVVIEATDLSGTRSPVGEGAVVIQDRASLILGLPGYYQNNQKGGAGFQEPMEVMGTEQRLDYGTSAGLAGTVDVTFRRVVLRAEGGVCYVREEGGLQEVIVREAENLSVEVRVSAEARSASITASFRGTYRGATPLISTFDRVLLRNPALDLRP
jgi:hypothetical protein